MIAVVLQLNNTSICCGFVVQLVPTVLQQLARFRLCVVALSVRALTVRSSHGPSTHQQTIKPSACGPPVLYINTMLNKGKGKVAHTRLPSVGFHSWSRFLAVSLQMMWVTNPAVGCHYFSPGLQLPPQPLRQSLKTCLEARTCLENENPCLDKSGSVLQFLQAFMLF